MTIIEAIQKVLKEAKTPLSVGKIFEAIVGQELYQFKAIDPKAVVRTQLRRHCVGLDFPSANPVKHFALVGSDTYKLASEEDSIEKTTTPSPPDKDKIPEEIIDDAHRAHLQVLREQLKEKILQNHPAFFERLVIDLLIRLGYGGGDPSLGIHTGGPGDLGIDGIIKEDRLGLDQIYIQAKRYSLDSAVGPAEIQQFAGAMNKIRKGVFITTTRFTKFATAAAEKHEKAISLIDGDLLCDLMISTGVGVSEVKTYAVLRVDNDYFSSTD
jgi:restriction system protein